MHELQQSNGRKHFVAVDPEASSGAVPPGRSSESEYILSFGDLLQIIRNRLWLIVLITLLLTGAVTAYTLLAQTPRYEASIKVLVGQAQVDEESRASLGGQIQGLQDLSMTMAEAVDTSSVAEAVIQRSNLPVMPEEFLSNLSAEQIPETQFVRISYQDTDPLRAQQIANTVGDEFSRKVAEVSPSANSVTATVWERAALPDEPVSPKPLQNALLALAVGAILGMSLAFLLEQLDDTWRSPEEVEQIAGVAVLGMIPKFKVAKAKENKAKEKGGG